MIVDEMKPQLYTLKTTCAISQRYHQLMEWRWGFADKTVRILVGIFAVLGVLITALGAPGSSWSLCVGLVSVVIAIALNVIPLGEREKFHAELFRAWSELRKDTERLEVTVLSSLLSSKVKAYHFERFQELADKAHALNSSEPAPWRQLLIRCQGDEMESQWGEGIRTAESIEKERKRRLEEGDTNPSLEVEAAVG